MHRVLSCCFFLLFCCVASGTTQEPEVFLEGKQEFPLLTEPLEKDNDVHWRTKLAIDELVDRGYRTSLYRRYQAQWRVENDRLLLVKIRVARGLEWIELPLQRVFHKADGQAVPATWFSGDLVIGEGAEMPCEPPSFSMCFSAYRVMAVERGAIRSIQHLKGPAR